MQIKDNTKPMRYRTLLIITILISMLTLSSCIVISTTRSRSEQDKKSLNKRANSNYTRKKHKGPNKMKVWWQRKAMLHQKDKNQKK